MGGDVVDRIVPHTVVVGVVSVKLAWPRLRLAIGRRRVGKVGVLGQRPPHRFQDASAVPKGKNE